MSKGQRKGKRQPKPRPKQVTAAAPAAPAKKRHPVWTVMKLLSALIAVGLAVFLAVRWSAIPDQVPTAFDEAGVPVEYAGKNNLIFMPVVGALMVVMVLLLINDNRTWRFPFRVRDDMRKKINGIMNNTMLLLTLEIELLFALLCLSMALSWAPPPYLLPGLMAAVIVTVIGGNLMCYAAGGQKKDSGSGSGPSRPSGGSSPLTEPPANSLARRY